MKITFIVAHDREPDGWEETHETDKGGTAEERAARVIAFFNDTLRPGELPRRLIKVVNAEDTPLKPVVNSHHWEKQNLVTVIDRLGSYDVMKCKACGATGKRFGLALTVSIDAKFKKPKFDPCPGYDL